MIAGTQPPQPTGPPESSGPPERPLTPGEALQKLFLDNADNHRNAANDELIAALRQRARQIQALTDPPATTPCPTQNDSLSGDTGTTVSRALGLPPPTRRTG